MAGYIETPDSAETIPPELWDGIDWDEVKRLAAVDEENAGKSYYERMPQEVREFLEDAGMGALVEESKNFIAVPARPPDNE